MNRIEQLLTFTKEFLADKSLEAINENVILSLKETSEKAIRELQSENESFWENLRVPTPKKQAYIKMNKDCKASVLFLSQLSNRGHSKMRNQHLFSISDDEDDSSFDNTGVCFENLKTLLMDLEIEFHHFVKGLREDISGELKNPELNELTKIPMVLISDFFENYSQLNTLFRHQQANLGALRDGTEQAAKIKRMLTDCHKDKLLTFLWNKLRDTKRICKILAKIMRSCFCLYGGKVITGPEERHKRKESISEKMSSIVNRPYSSIKMSMNLSKIKSRRSMKFGDSFANDVNDIFFIDDMSAQFKIKCSEVRFEDEKKGPPLPNKSYLPIKGNGKKHNVDEGLGKCYCAIF